MSVVHWMEIISACLLGVRLLADYGRRVTAVPEVQYWWHEAPVPAGLEITQVYGYLLCPVTCRVLVQDDDGVFNLIGVRAGSLSI